MSAKPVIALLTDFGLHDHYVGAMKGVILGICPDATIVDITHDLPAQDVIAASFELDASYRFFPPSTIFVCVVDPGVGTKRRAIAANAGEYTFLAPDNGLLAHVLGATAPDAIVELTNERYQLADVSRTFEGRDRFAPAAAWLARGVAIDEFGARVKDWTPLGIPSPTVSADSVAGCVVRVDRFGNLITNVDRRMLASACGARTPAIPLGARRIDRVVNTYADVPAHDLCAIVGSSGFVEIAANRDHASRRLGVGTGAPVVFRLC